MVFRLITQNIMRLHDWVQSIEGYFHCFVIWAVIFGVNGCTSAEIVHKGCGFGLRFGLEQKKDSH